MERLKRGKLVEHPIHRNNYFSKAFEGKQRIDSHKEKCKS